MHKMKEKYDIGVIVGRFQVAELTEAHKQIINTVKENHKQYIIVVGVSPTLGTKTDPLGYTARMKMLQKDFPDAIITHLMDVNSDNLWSKELDKLIRAICPLGSVCLYGGRDSFIKSYTGIYSTFEMSIIGEHQGTKTREDIGKEVFDSVDFRKGVIYSCQNQYPKVFQTVDMAVVKSEGIRGKRDLVYSVLLARRKESDLLQFFGGFVDPSDHTLEDAAKRELGEEVDVEIDVDSVEYVYSTLIDDWRYNNTSERIMTALFQMKYVFGSGSIKDEFHSSEWVELNYGNIRLVKDGHKPLFISLLKHNKIKEGKTNGEKPYITHR